MSRLIHVKAYQRRRPGKRTPKWLLYDLKNDAVLVNIRAGTLHKDLGSAKIYFRTDLKRFAAQHFGEDWAKRVVLLAVR